MSSSKGNIPHKRYTRKQKFLIGLLIFIIIDVALFMFTVTRYTGYDLINSEKYVEFRMPKEKTLTEQEWQALVKNTRVIKYPKVQLSREINNIKNQVEEMAKANVKAKLVLHAIAEKKRVSVSKTEIDKAEKGILKEKGVNSETEYKKLTGESLGEHVKEIDLELKLLYAKIVKK